MLRTLHRSIVSKFKSPRNAARRQAAAYNRRRFLSHEPLEPRALLATLVTDVIGGTADTTVSGTVYEDLNSNGTRDGGESGIAGWTVFLDLDQSGTLNRDAHGTLEPSATTNQDGDYVIPNLNPGTYRVTEVVPAGWTPTSPVSVDVTVVQSHDSRADFFNFGGGDIVGTVWNDANDDGNRATDPVTGEFTEPGLTGWTIYLDLDNSKTQDPGEPATVTDREGRYAFHGVPAGDYEVFEVLPAGWEAAKGYDTKQTATVTALQQTTSDFANIGVGVGSLSGTIWHDVNLDGIRNIDPATGDFAEPGLADWTVFLDTVVPNRLPDPGEPTGTTDADGRYVFPSLAEGDYDVVEVLPAGWDVSPEFDSQQTVTVGAGRDTIAGDFANFSVLNGSIRGTVWNDRNRNGVRDTTLAGVFTDPGLPGWTIYLDRNGNHVADPGEPTAVTGPEGDYAFHDLQTGDYDVREILPSGWETAPLHEDSATVTVFSGTESLAPDFANFTVATSTPGSVAGNVWDDANGNGLKELSEPGLVDWRLFLDSNSNGLLDAGEPETRSGLDGSYAFAGILPGSVSIVSLNSPGWKATAPATSVHTLALRSGQEVAGLNFGKQELKDSTIRGVVFADSDKNGVRAAGERGLAGITVYLDLDHSGTFDTGEPQMVTSADQFFTPDANEAGAYSFTHLGRGTYPVRMIAPAVLSATPASGLVRTVTITTTEDRADVDFAAVFRPNEIHGVKFEDQNGNHQRDLGEPGVGGATIYLDLDRDDLLDSGEPSTMTAEDGSYAFTGLSPGAYVVREIVTPGYEATYPTTGGGTLWPTGESNSAVGSVSPLSITMSLAKDETYRQNVSLTLPGSGALTNLVDVFLLFDDTGSFVNNSPIVRAAFPDIMRRLQTALPGIDLGFGVGRFEEYGNFAAEYATGRPFILNQPIVAASTAGHLAAIQAALNRTTPGYGGDQPETDIEALYQLVTGLGFDGNNNGSVLDSGPAGLALTQLNPGASGDVPSFASFIADPAANVMPAAGTIGGAGFRAGALPIILTATDTGFAFQPKGETAITGAGITLPLSALTQTARPTTPFNSGAGIQETVTALNALGALVIGLGTNPQSTLDPRQGLESLSKLTGAINRSTTTIANGTADPIAPGDPLYFQIASGFSASVADGVVNAIQNAVTNVAVNINIQASDPRVKIINHMGVIDGVAAGQTATFDMEIVGDGVPHRFDLQFVRAGTNVVLGSIPVVLGTPIKGSCYDFEDLEEGEIEFDDDFGEYLAAGVPINVAPSFTAGANQIVLEDSGPQTVPGWSTNISPGPASESGQLVHFVVTSDNTSLFGVQPAVSPDGSLTFTPAADAHGTATLRVVLHDNGGTANGGIDTSPAQSFTISVTAVNDAPTAAADSYVAGEDQPLGVAASGVLGNDSDLEGNPLSAVLVVGPAHGTVVLHADGSFTYTPAADYNGPDSFTYKANDGMADSTEATVAITVSAVNDAPVTAGDTYSVKQDTTLSVPVAAGVLVNDYDVDGDSLAAQIVAQPGHGTLTINADGSFAYSPSVGYTGQDTFVYRASDGFLASEITTVTIDVQPVAMPGSTRFLVVDRTVRDTFEYDANGKLVDRNDLMPLNVSPRGIATNAEGSRRWVVDSRGIVFVYDSDGHFQSAWYAAGTDQAEGIATNGRDIWIVDRDEGKVVFYAGAAARRWGIARPTSAFELDPGNRHAMDVATDGVYVWVVDDAAEADRVFRYTVGGKTAGMWTIDPRNSRPTGLTIDPKDVNHIWIVDAGTDSVYQYDGAAKWNAGSAVASDVFPLAQPNTNPQGIADFIAGNDKPPVSLQHTTLPAVDRIAVDSPVGHVDALPSREHFLKESKQGKDHGAAKRSEHHPSAALSKHTIADHHDQALSELLEEVGHSPWDDLLDNLKNRSGRHGGRIV